MWQMGGKKSSSDMLIGNERPFSWAGGQHRCMMGNWLFAEAEDEHGELPRLRGNNEGVHRKDGWSLQQSSMISRKEKKPDNILSVCHVDLYLPFPPIYYIYNVSRNFKKHQQQLINQ